MSYSLLLGVRTVFIERRGLLGDMVVVCFVRAPGRHFLFARAKSMLADSILVDKEITGISSLRGDMVVVWWCGGGGFK